MQVLKCSGWMDYRWIDYSLKWDPNEFGNITSIRVPATNLWTPGMNSYAFCYIKKNIYKKILFFFLN